MPNSSRACTVNAMSGCCITSAAADRARSGPMPCCSYIAASSAVSCSGLRRSSLRSTSSSRSIRSLLDDTDTHSPAAIEIPPATAPARPARRTTPTATPEPAKPSSSETLETSPSLAPNTAARARPPLIER